MRVLEIILLAAVACASTIEREAAPSKYNNDEMESSIIVKREANPNLEPGNPYTPGTYAYNFVKYGAQIDSIYGLTLNYGKYRSDFFKKYGRYPNANDYAERRNDINGAKFRRRFGYLNRFQVKRRFGHLSRSAFFQRYGFYPPVNYNFGTPTNPEYWY